MMKQSQRGTTIALCGVTPVLIMDPKIVLC